MAGKNHGKATIKEEVGYRPEQGADVLIDRGGGNNDHRRCDQNRHRI